MLKEGEEVKYDPNLFYMTKAQACAYKAYKVTKYNRRGRAQKRVLGIDQLRLYNLTQAQAAKQEVTRATGANVNIMRNKFKAIYRSVTHRPEILISSVLEVGQEQRNLNFLHIEYLDNNIKKRKLY